MKRPVYIVPPYSGYSVQGVCTEYCTCSRHARTFIPVAVSQLLSPANNGDARHPALGMGTARTGKELYGPRAAWRVSSIQPVIVPTPGWLTTAALPAEGQCCVDNINPPAGESHRQRLV